MGIGSWRGLYPENWTEVTVWLKGRVDRHCEVCGEKFNGEPGRCLTVHHLDLDRSNNRHWNLIVVCYGCKDGLENSFIMELITVKKLLLNELILPEWLKWRVREFKRDCDYLMELARS